MRVLILGGTGFIGRHIVETLRASGHSVTVLTRGISQDELPPEVERLRGNRDEGRAGIRALDGRTWDACVDVSGYTPRQVRASVESLRSRIARYLFISAVSVYGDPTGRPVRETHPRLAPAPDDVEEIDAETYGPLKVACEDVVQEAFGDRTVILRPQIVAGPYDSSGRYGYWVWRAQQGGEMVAPGGGSDHLQVIDARDLARFTRIAIERELKGAYNLAGPRLTWRDFIDVLGARDPVWVPASILRAAGVTEQELPLFREERGPRSGLMDVSCERAIAAGLTLTDPAITARDTWVWLQDRRFEPRLSLPREAELIRVCRQPNPHRSA